MAHLCSKAQIQLLLSRENMEFARRVRSWSLTPQDQTMLDQIDRVCCTGGTAKAYVVRRELEKRFAIDKLENFRHFSSIVEELSQRAQERARASKF